MMSADTNISDAYFCNLRSTDFNAVPCVEINHVNRFGSCLRNRFYDHVVLGIRVDVIIQKIDNLSILANKGVSEWRLTYFTLQAFPNVRIYDWSFLAVSLAFEPRFQA